ncbi:MAG: YMGG-like glycine zipper-containing protein [Candidatus Methylomirabilia bacterium]
MRKVMWSVVAVLVLAGCASGPMTTREKATVGGAALGAGTGALIGAAAGGKPGTGALIGAGIGALSGVLLGDQLQKVERERGAAAPLPPTVVTESQAPSTVVASKPSGDPTKGELINGTSWSVRVYVNADPNNLGATTPVVLGPNQTAPWNLDIGTYRIIARAYASTQYGERLVGRFDRTIQIDPRRPGWFLKFHDSDFR